MARDIEEFLRKAAERRRQQQAEKQGQQPTARKPDIVSRQPTRATEQPWKRQTSRNRPTQPDIIEVVEVLDDDVIEAQPVQPRRGANSGSRRQSVQSEVQSHIDTSKIARHAEELGRLKAQTSGDVDAVKEKFDRGAKKFESKRVGSDNTDSDIVGQDVSAVASDLVNMLRDPKSIQQAILVSEILRRPGFDDE
jgi:hypothetical protein